MPSLISRSSNANAMGFSGLQKPIYQPKASVFDNPRIRLNILQTAFLKRQEVYADRHYRQLKMSVNGEFFIDTPTEVVPGSFRSQIAGCSTVNTDLIPLLNYPDEQLASSL